MLSVPDFSFKQNKLDGGRIKDEALQAIVFEESNVVISG